MEDDDDEMQIGALKVKINTNPQMVVSEAMLVSLGHYESRQQHLWCCDVRAYCHTKMKL